MKLRSYFFGALACLALASCSSDDDAVASGEEFDPSKTHYVAINIVNPTETRATGGDFEIGSDTENQIDEAVLIFYDEDNKYISHVSRGHNDDALNQWQETPSTETTPGVEKITKAVCVLNDLTDEPKSVLAVMNYTVPSEFLTKGGENATLAKLKAHIAESVTINTAAGDFVMTNSAYQGNCETPLTPANIQSSEVLALSSPVIIYVERIVAKVELKLAEGLANNSALNLGTTTLTIDGTAGQVVKPTIEGHGFVGTNTTHSYLIKNLGGKNWEWTGWNDATNKRSYWAVSAVPTAYNYYSWTELDGQANVFPLYTEEEGINNYFYENTTNNPSNEKGYSADAKTATTLVLPATLKIGDEAVDLVRHAGIYYTKENFLQVVENHLNGKHLTYIYGGTANQTDWSSILEMKLAGAPGANAYKATPELKDDANIEFDSPAIQTAVNDALDALGEAYYWNQGKTYFFVTVEHFGTPDCTHGIVRNHIYEISIGGTTGLGTPVVNPGDDIIPERPGTEETESHVAAQIKILKWKIVKQSNVILQ